MTHQTTDNLPPTHGTPKRSNSMVPDGTSWDPVSVIHGWGQGGGVIHQLRRPPQPKPRKHAGAVAALHLHSCNTLKCKCSTLIAGEREREGGDNQIKQHGSASRCKDLRAWTARWETLPCQPNSSSARILCSMLQTRWGRGCTSSNHVGAYRTQRHRWVSKRAQVGERFCPLRWPRRYFRVCPAKSWWCLIEAVQWATRLQIVAPLIGYRTTDRQSVGELVVDDHNCFWGVASTTHPRARAAYTT